MQAAPRPKRIPWITRSLTLFAFLVLFCLVQRQDDIASNGQSNRNYHSFSSCAPAQASAIRQYWQEDPARIDAVHRLVLFGYILLFISCTYLVFSLYFTARREKRKGLRAWLFCGMALVLIGSITWALQDTRISILASGSEAIPDLRPLGYVKWITICLGIFPLVFALLFPGDNAWRFYFTKTFRLLGHILKAVWLFFPSIIFVLLLILCFWTLGQGKDFIVAFTNNHAPHSTGSFNYNRMVFFLLTGFFVYVSWYGSRIISYVKKTQQKDDLMLASGMT